MHSLPFIIQSNISNISQMGRDIEESLKIYLSKFFDGAEITVDINKVVENGIESETKFNINIDAILIQDGSQLSLGKAISVSNSKVSQVVNRT